LKKLVALSAWSLDKAQKIMPEYAWKALSADGKKQAGKSHAADVGALAASLEQAGQLLLKAHVVKPLFSFGSKKVEKVQLINFSFQLSMMLRAGVTILEALRDIADAEDNPTFRQIIGELGDSLGGGKTLSQAMASHPKIFDEVYVNLIQSGEQTGQMTEVLEDLTETLKWQHEMAAQTKKAMIYPIVVLVVVTVVLLFMLGYVVPQVAELLRTMRIALPWQTRFLIFLSEIVLGYWKLMLAGFIVLIIFLTFFAKIPGPMRAWLDKIKLKIPVVGRVLTRIALARFSYVLAMLYAAGITVMDALKVVELAVGNHAMASAIRRARVQISKGKSLSAAFSGSDLFPPMVISMLRVGEATGSLDTALKNVSYMYTREARESVENLQASLQPILTVVLGLIVALIMAFTLGPLYENIVGGAKF
jgi:type IV pilus assembly protein PilC